MGSGEWPEGQIGEACCRLGSEVDAERGQHRETGDGEGEVAADGGAEEPACDGDGEAEKITGGSGIEHLCSLTGFLGS